MFATNENQSFNAFFFVRLVIRQPPTQIADDVLSAGFDKLTLKELYAVAHRKCQLEKMARIAFSTTLNGRLVFRDEHTRTVPLDQLRDSRSDMLRIFGPLTKQLECTVATESWGLKWRFLSTNNLQTIKIDVSQILAICQTNATFHQLERLELSGWKKNHWEGDNYRNINFSRKFPSLKTLKLGEFVELSPEKELLPRGLQSLKLCACSFRSMDAAAFESLLHYNPNLQWLQLCDPPLDLNEVIDLMYDCGIGLSLESFTLIAGGDRRSCQLSGNFMQFERLKSVRLHVRMDVCTADNAMLFAQMPMLECLTIAIKPGTHLDVHDFLMAMATNVPPHLMQFSLSTSDRIKQKVWTKFVAAMPSTCKCQKHRE